MSIIGYFKDLAEAQKLVQDKKLAGVIQQIFEEGQLLGRLPVTQIDSKLLTYIRQKTRPSPAQYGIGAEIPWSSGVEFEDEVKVGLTRSAYATPLDNFMLTAYKDPNDYRAQILKGLTEGCMAYIEDLIIYGDGGTDNPTGLDKLCPAGANHTFATGYQDQDMGGSGSELTITALLDCIDACKPKPNVLVMTRALRNQITLFTMTKQGAIVYASDIDKDFGRRIEYINSIPVIVSDYLTTENDETGGKLGTGNYVSLYAIRFGSIEDGGLSLVVGGDTGRGNMLFKVRTLGELEGYDAEGIRLTAYWNLALGSTKAISRIHSIDQTVAVTVAGT